jgi:pimeloyl-ACP methyl ester carboxylesterase
MAVKNEQQARDEVVTSFQNAPTHTVSAGGVDFAYRELGPKTGVRSSSSPTWPRSSTTGTLGSSTASPRNTGRRAGKEFLARLKERTDNRDKAISLRSYGAQLKAIHRWGLDRPSDLSVIRRPVLVANGESDRMVPTKNSADLARRLPDSELVIYPDAGHGGFFQFHTTSPASQPP